MSIYQRLKQTVTSNRADDVTNSAYETCSKSLDSNVGVVGWFIFAMQKKFL